MKKILMGVLVFASMSIFAKTENYDCKTIQSIDPQPNLHLTIKTPFYSFNPKQINGERSKRSIENNPNYFSLTAITERYGVDEFIVEFMKDSKLGMFYTGMESKKTYMFNHSFPWADSGDYAFLVVKSKQAYSFYECSYLD